MALVIGWNNAINKKLNIDSSTELTLSVIVPVRNEEKFVGYLLQDLKKQNFNSYEVLIVDDCSDDSTSEVVNSEIGNDERFFYTTNPGRGKKSALTEGIRKAKGAIIVTTDADCRVGVDWLTSISTFFHNDDVKLAFGAVRIHETGSLFSSCQALEFSSLIGSGVATMAFGLPSMCNGANLAFRKETFEAVGGYSDNQHLPSGDDEFLLHKIFKIYPRGIRFMNDARAIVTTNAQFSWKDFVNQRIRWAGKWNYHKNLFNTFLPPIIFIFHLSVILMLLLDLVGILSPKQILVLLTAKILVEFLFLRRISFFLNNKCRWVPFLLLQIVYPFYVVFIGLISNFMSFEWKGRILKSSQIKSTSG